jgi:hypothetical protein
MVDLSSGRADGVNEEKAVVRGDESAQIEEWVVGLVSDHRRAEHERPSR